MKFSNTVEENAGSGQLGRRSFIKGAGMTGFGLAGVALIGARLGALDKMPGAASLGLRTPGVKASSGFDTDLDTEIGVFAMNLEYLEAEFYTVAVTGKGLTASGIDVTGLGTAGPTTGGNQVDFSGDASGKLQAIATEIMMDEQQHVAILRSLLGSQTPAKPAINLAALGIGFSSFQSFLQLSRAFEDTGVSAYGGAAPLITRKADLAYAVRIGLIEAYHASLIRGLIAENNVATTKTDSQDVLPPPTGTQYFTDTGALAVVRTTSEVLAIVYDNPAAGTSSGGFFPDGVNGNINTV